MTPLFSISPKNHIRVLVGYFNFLNREAVFKITPQRFFQQAEGGTGAVGVDEKLIRQKWFNFCDTMVFKMFDGRIYRIKKSDFMENCWLYPGKAAKDYKAFPGGFVPKLVVSLDRLKELAAKQQKVESDEILKLAVR